ncbi:MAG: hypothetical protein QOD60_150 [Solirubrobacterales bacterium]|jgi:hypothetical protein|nr:hypothetical protein [Solirubrobacterales bacterium]
MQAQRTVSGRRRGSTPVVLSIAFVLSLAVLVTGALAAQPPVGLGTADSFAVLAGSAVTNTGPSTINGDLGVSPGTAISGFPPGTVNGATHAADAVAIQAQSDLTTAYNDAAGRTPPAAVPGGNLGGLTLTRGVYNSASSLDLTGALTLDAQGNPNSVFIFQAGSTLTTASASRVNLINGAQPCNVYWKVGSSATLGTTTAFVGNLLALTSISVNNGVVVNGRLLARNGAVTLINDTVTAPHCTTTGAVPPGNGTASLTTVPPWVSNTVSTPGTPTGTIPGAPDCVDKRFKAVVNGLFIRQVVFSLDGKKIARKSKAPFAVSISAGPGVHNVKAHVTFTDGTAPATLRFRFRECNNAAANPPRRPRGPGGFTG